MSEMGDTFRAWREHKQQERQNRAGKNASLLRQAQLLAQEAGFELVAHTHWHYQLKGPGKRMWNLYPSNQRIYVDNAHRDTTPFLTVGHGWTLLSAVQAAINAVGKDKK